MPALPEAPRALAEEPGEAIELAGDARGGEAPGDDGAGAGDVAVVTEQSDAGSPVVLGDEAEDAILKESLSVFARRAEAFRGACSGDVEQFYAGRLSAADSAPGDLWQGGGKVAAEEALSDRLAQMPEGLTPIVVAGGSFNSSRRRTQMRPEDRAFIDALLDSADPSRVFFVVGHTLSAQEGYLVRRAAGAFRVFAIVPSQITRQEGARLRAAEIGVLVSIESSGMGLYKSFSYEVFRRFPSVLLAFDGNSAALNLIQEARNSRNKCRIFVNSHSRGLSEKAALLKGYVTYLQDPAQILREADAAPAVL
jgi:hypothetical protein